MSQDIINMIAGCVGAIGGWVLKVIWDAIKELQSDMRDFQSEVHTRYVTKDDYKDDIREIKTILREIFDKLDKKVDR